MAVADRDLKRSTFWGAALAGAALFLITGLELVLGEIPHDWTVPAWFPTVRYVASLGFLFMPAIGFGIGWIRSFPGWSYPYVGMTLITSLYMMNVATPGLRILGYEFGRNDLWGWRAWIPLAVMAAVGLLITRSLEPVLRLFTNVWEDWTLLTFGMFGFMPLLVAIGFDEVDRLYSLPFMVVLTLVMAGTAFAYLGSAYQRQRVLALVVGLFLVTTIVTAAPTMYWLENGWVDVERAVISGAFVTAFMLSPGLVPLVRRSIGSARDA